jgi:arylsulfatase A-like enzyme
MEPGLIGYTDVAPDPRVLSPEDPKRTQWDAGMLPGIKNLSEDNDLGSPQWLRETGVAEELGTELMAEIEEPGFVSWNGWQGDVHWLEVPLGMKARDDAPPLSSGYPTPAAYRAENSDTYVMTNQAIDHITERSSAKQPWALHLSLLKPHPPFLAPTPYNEKVHPCEAGLPKTRGKTAADEASIHPYLKAEHSEGTLRPLVQNDTGSLDDVSDEELRLLRSSYFGLISEVDDNIGRLLEAVEKLGEDKTTLIIFTSDHGDLLGDHWFRGKVGFHDGAFHVPLLLHDPRPGADMSRGTKVKAFTEHVDLAPTILDYLGLSPREFDGKSLRPHVESRPGSAPVEWREAAHWEYDFRFRPSGEKLRREYGLAMEDCTLLVMRTATRKLVYFGGGLQPLLFDMQVDPGELKDVAKDPRYSKDLQQMLAELHTWRSKVSRSACDSLTRIRLRAGGCVLRYDSTTGEATNVGVDDPLFLSANA